MEDNNKPRYTSDNALEYARKNRNLTSPERLEPLFLNEKRTNLCSSIKGKIKIFFERL
ncbi:hypothetical protein HGA32_02130 [Candidatus Gracilibacteria bacterium]|nr:hypothetical protein [Candidatus Gracilibacteria bacterium]